LDGGGIFKVSFDEFSAEPHQFGPFAGIGRRTYEGAYGPSRLAQLPANLETEHSGRANNQCHGLPPRKSMPPRAAVCQSLS
jgi:hypothetical protein